MAGHDKSGCLLAIFRMFRAPDATNKSPSELPYRRKDFLLSKAERSFFEVLHQAVGKDYWLFTKIRVADLLWMPKGTKSRQSHFNRIQAKHIDFVLCDHDSTRPILAIELDDSSHGSSPRQSRDVFVDEALRVAGLPLLRVPCKSGYNVNQLKSQILATLNPIGKTA
jgi:hypothetical protein